MIDLLEGVSAGLAKDLDEELSTPLIVGASTRGLDYSSSNKRKAVKSAFSFLTTAVSSKILQVSPLPTPLKLSDFANALSNVNPEGDIIAAQKFQQLVDPLPKLTHMYMTSPSSIEAVYGSILRGASTPIGNTYLANIIANARRRFDTCGQANLIGSGEWRVVEAYPSDWYMENSNRYKKVKIDLTSGSNAINRAKLHEDKLSPTIVTVGENQMSLSPRTNLTHCEFEYMLVRFIRPWMDFTLFKTDGWWLTGQPIGYCSSGRKDENAGVLPLISTGMIIARSVIFEGDWDPADQKLIDRSRSTNEAVFVGPYKLSGEAESADSVNLIAWISELVPLSPLVDDSSFQVSFHFSNEGLYTAVCVVKWCLQKEQKKTRCLLKPGKKDTIKVPIESSDVVVIIRAKNGYKKKLAFRKSYGDLANKHFGISGSFENIQVQEQ